MLTVCTYCTKRCSYHLRLLISTTDRKVDEFFIMVSTKSMGELMNGNQNAENVEDLNYDEFATFGHYRSSENYVNFSPFHCPNLDNEKEHHRVVNEAGMPARTVMVLLPCWRRFHDSDDGKKGNQLSVCEVSIYSHSKSVEICFLNSATSAVSV